MIIGNKHSGYSRDGIRVYPMDGGGGNSSAPTSQNITQTSIPEYARPYVEQMLGKTEALTGAPTPVYPGQQNANFTGLQQQAQGNVANMQAPGQTGFASGLAGAAGIGALNTQYNAPNIQGSQFNQAAANQYMSPYMQSVVDVQQQEAQRQSDIAGTQRNAQATGAGAFGGSRQAIMDAEAARNLATQKGSIQATGLQNAYSQAQNQYNADQASQMQANQLNAQQQQYGAGLGMQGLQTANAAAGQLGALGQNAYTQDMGINQLQQSTGATQQAQQQALLNTQYQNYLTQQQAPYQQLSYMSDMLRGLPMSQSTSSLFQAPPSLASTAAGLGTAAYGASKLMAKKGGSVADIKKRRPAGLAELALSKMA
tara:strand:- start:3766 stop:4872 length:1107 start_codon:yes stop_codon:yes gene_type:complete